MKIAIKANKKRGKDIITLLENLGGINKNKWCGDGGLGNSKTGYYIKNCYIEYGIIPKDYEQYTIEEFEAQFPFKVGDLCIYISDILNEEIIVRILGMVVEDDCIMYEIGHRNTTNAHSGIYKRRHTLKPYKKTKEERNIILTLEKAKEWYKKGGDLKQVALQAFSEQELNPCIEYIDLGLPSGTLWADTNEDRHYSYQEAIDNFGKNNLPKLTDFAELYDYCKWEWSEEKKGMVITGPNGKHIFFPASGYRNCYDDRLDEVDYYGYYWSVTPSYYYAYYLYFYNDGFVYSSSNGSRVYRYAIRKIKRK